MDNNYEMIIKRLKLQYADAQAHDPKYVQKRIQFLDGIRTELEHMKMER